MTNHPITTGPTIIVRRPIVVWDIVVTIILLVMGIAGTIVISLTAIGLAFAADRCTGLECNQAQFSAGVIVALIGPSFAFVIATILSIVRLAQRRRAFWVPLVGFLVVALVWFGGAAIAVTAIPGYSFG